MKKIALSLLALTLGIGAFAQNNKECFKDHFKVYGFVRNYFAFDTRESVAGTGDLYYWLPKDSNLNELGEDMNAQNQFRFLSLTSRVGLDVFGYKVKNTEFGAKIEADFYAGLTNSKGTAQLRLRQAFATIKWAGLGEKKQGYINLKLGQAWHPVAADLPDIFSLESGAPFNAFSRTPQVTADFGLSKNWMLTASALWQMQYTSTGPVGSSANYIKYALTPEVYAGVTYKTGGFLARAGVDVLSIKPRNTAEVTINKEGVPVKTTMKVNDRLTTISPFVYLQYTDGKFKFKAKSILSQGGEHMNLMSGYALKSMTEDNSLWEYTPMRTSSSWLTVSYGKKVVGALLLGYIQSLGTTEDVYSADGKTASADDIFYQPNGFSWLNRMWRVQPEIVYNVGKFNVGLEYMLTGVQYGGQVDGAYRYNLRGLCTDNLHWIMNHRVQAMVKFNF